MRHGNRRRTLFWGFSQRAAELLEPTAGGPWLSRYAWWNVYPLGWQDRHGTPTDELHAVQTPFVADLFWAVAEELQVKRLLLVSGKGWWWNVRELLGLQALRATEKPVIAAGTVRGINVVATYHPGAHMAGVTRDAFAAAAVEAMRSLTMTIFGPPVDPAIQLVHRPHVLSWDPCSPASGSKANGHRACGTLGWLAGRLTAPRGQRRGQKGWNRSAPAATGADSRAVTGADTRI